MFDLVGLRQSCATCGLQELCLTATIGLDQVKRLDSVVETKRRIESGNSLFLQGSPARALYVVRAGSFKTYVSSAAGQDQIIGFHHPGEILGLDGLGENLHACGAKALERSSICAVPHQRLLQTAAQVPGLQRQLLRIVGRVIARDHTHLLALGRARAAQRLAAFLLALSDRYGELRRDPLRLRLTMSRNDIANYLGLALETVSRWFGRLATAGIIEVQSRKVRILNYAALQRVCESADADEKSRTRQF